MSAILIQSGDLKSLKKLPDKSVNCIIASPPPWNHNISYKAEDFVYNKDCKHKLFKFPEGDMTRLCTECNSNTPIFGREIFSHLYIQNLLLYIKELHRVLQDDGTLFLHLKDGVVNEKNRFGIQFNTPQGSLALIPQIVATSMVDNGWILRNKIIWHKPGTKIDEELKNLSPDYNFIYFFVKQENYFFEQQFEPIQEGYYKMPKDAPYATKGRNMRTVWSIPDKTNDGLAPELVSRFMKAGCPTAVCEKCGHKKKPIYEIIEHEPLENYKGKAVKDYGTAKVQNASDIKRRILKSMYSERKLKGYTECECGSTFAAGVVLDPFCNSKVTRQIAKTLGLTLLGMRSRKSRRKRNVVTNKQNS